MGRVGDYVDSSRQATVPSRKLFSTTTAREESKCSHFLLKHGTPGCLLKDSSKSPGGSSWLTNAHIEDFLLSLYTGMATVLTSLVGTHSLLLGGRQDKHWSLLDGYIWNNTYTCPCQLEGTSSLKACACFWASGKQQAPNRCLLN